MEMKILTFCIRAGTKNTNKIEFIQFLFLLATSLHIIHDIV